MGYLWHDRPVDHGIDGEIELVSPDGTPLNIVVMVQSKARGRPFADETADSFQWTADAADLDYWLSGNAPVIVVLSRPAEDLAWWFDVSAEFNDPVAAPSAPSPSASTSSHSTSQQLPRSCTPPCPADPASTLPHRRKGGPYHQSAAGPGLARHPAPRAGSDDQDRLHQFSDLLRRTLVSDRSRDIQWHQARRHLHFRATRDLRPRV